MTHVSIVFPFCKSFAPSPIRPAFRVACWRLSLLAWVVVETLVMGQVTLEPSSAGVAPASPSTASRNAPFNLPGALVIVGGGGTPAEARERFVQLAGGSEAHIVVVPTASATAEERDEEYWLETWRDFQVASLTVFHTRDRLQADSEEFCQPLQQATGIWFPGGSQNRIVDAFMGTRAQQIIESLPYRLVVEGRRGKRGGVVGGTSAGAAIASRIMIAGGRTNPELATGFDLLPRAIVDQHFSQRNRQQRLEQAVQQHPECVGMGIDERTAVIVTGRSLVVQGRGQAHLRFAATEYQPAAALTLQPTVRYDWQTILRTQQQRQQTPFPNHDSHPVKFPEQGALVIVGGGGMPREVVQKFVELAGGSEARIVILPTAVDAPSRESGLSRTFQNAGAKAVTVLPQIKFEEINNDEYLSVLQQATGIWFGGGRQWHFIDHYENTPAFDAFHALLSRGGVIGGSSAGASIQGELLIRGAPVGNQIMVQDGYRKGFSFLPGVGIDQHFSQRNRLPDLKQAIADFPQFMGVGIDEGTALVVSPNRAEVIGRGSVYLLKQKSADENANSAEIDSADTDSNEVGSMESGVVESGITQPPADDVRAEKAMGSAILPRELPRGTVIDFESFLDW